MASEVLPDQSWVSSRVLSATEPLVSLPHEAHLPAFLQEGSWQDRISTNSNQTAGGPRLPVKNEKMMKITAITSST
jgi:hypothetical protein